MYHRTIDAILLVGAVFAWSVPAPAFTAAAAQGPEQPLAGSRTPDEKQVPPPDPAAGGAGTDLPAITKLPVVKRFVPAEYPERAEEEGIEAAVVLTLDIDTSGRVEAVEVVEGSGDAGYGFEEAALAAARQLEFEPAEAEGQPIPVRITYQYRFTLTERPRSPAAVTEPAGPRASFVGKLLERGTRLPVKGTSVTVFQGEGESAHGFEAVSDEQGSFGITDLEPGEWRVFIESPGYFPVRETELLRAGEKLEVTYRLERRSYNPFDVIVEAKHLRREVSRETIRTEEIEKIPGTSGDPLAVVSNLPSVARTFGGQLVVRGAAPEDSQVSIEGINVPYLHHFGGVRSIFPTGVLEAIDFYPGNYPIDYGRGTGGIFDLRLKKLQPERLRGYVDVSIMDAGIFIEAPLGMDGVVAVGGRRSYLDLLMKAAVPDDAGVRLIAAPRYYDYQILATYRPAREHEVSGFWYGTDDALKLLFQDIVELDRRIGSGKVSTHFRFHRGVLQHRWRTAGGLENEVAVSVGRDTSYTDVGEWYIDYEGTDVQVRDALRLRLHETLQVRAGADYVLRDNTWDVHFGESPVKEGGRATGYKLDSVATAKARSTRHSPAFFFEPSWSPIDGLLVVPAVRVDSLGRVRQLTVDPRLTARLQLVAALTLKAAAGVFHQEPTEDELDGVFGNPCLESERSSQYSVGFEYQPWPVLHVDVTGFYKRLGDLVTQSDDLVERNGRLVPERYNNDGAGRVYGVDVLVRHELANNFFGWVAYTLSRAERRDAGAANYRLFDYDQAHILTVLGSYRLPRDWELGVRWRFVTGNPYTPFMGGVFDADEDGYLPVSGRYNSGRLPSFHQLDVRIDKRWVMDTWMFVAYVDIQNAYNRRNAESYAYNFDYSERRPSGGLPLLTIVGLRAEL